MTWRQILKRLATPIVVVFAIAYFVIDARVARRFGRGLEAFASVENLADARYPAGLTPIEMLGAPRVFRVGLRLDHGHGTGVSPPGK